MNENDTRTTSISKSTDLQEIADFWDTHSLADYEEQIEEVRFELRAQRRRRVSIDPEVYERVKVRARVSGITPETLVNLWIVERLGLRTK